MEKYLEKNRSDLKDMTAVVREDLTRLHRKIIAALITIDVHARDIVEELWQEKVESVNDFQVADAAQVLLGRQGRHLSHPPDQHAV